MSDKVIQLEKLKCGVDRFRVYTACGQKIYNENGQELSYTEIARMPTGRFLQWLDSGSFYIDALEKKG